MNKGLTYIDGKVIVSDENGNHTQIDYYDNIGNVLVKENLIEENPIISPVCAISGGIINNEILLDLEYIEDSKADVDCNVVMNKKGEIIEFQSTAEGHTFRKEQLDELFETCKIGIQSIIKENYPVFD